MFATMKNMAALIDDAGGAIVAEVLFRALSGRQFDALYSRIASACASR